MIQIRKSFYLVAFKQFVDIETWWNMFFLVYLDPATNSQVLPLSSIKVPV